MGDVKGVAKGWVPILMVFLLAHKLLSGLKGVREEASFPEADPFVCPRSQAKRRSNYEEGKA